MQSPESLRLKEARHANRVLLGFGFSLAIGLWRSRGVPLTVANGLLVGVPVVVGLVWTLLALTVFLRRPRHVSQPMIAIDRVTRARPRGRGERALAIALSVIIGLFVAFAFFLIGYEGVVVGLRAIAKAQWYTGGVSLLFVAIGVSILVYARIQWDMLKGLLNVLKGMK